LKKFVAAAIKTTLHHCLHNGSYFQFLVYSMQTKKSDAGETWILRFTIGIIVLCSWHLFVFDYFVQFRMNDKELQTFFSKHNVPAQIRYYQTAGARFVMQRLATTACRCCFLFMVRPSSLSIYRDYYKDSLFLKTFRMYAVDRPGYGYSGLGKPEPSIQKQAAMIRPILDSLNKVKKPLVVMGGLLRHIDRLPAGNGLPAPGKRPGAGGAFVTARR
jgi:hypothetical protein